MLTMFVTILSRRRLYTPASGLARALYHTNQTCEITTPEHEGVFITLAVAEQNLIELCHNIDGAFVHQIQGSFLIGFGKLVGVGEFVETLAVNPDHDPGVGQQFVIRLELASVFKLAV